LALAREFVELHGGRLWVDATPGGGATFTFTLPHEAEPTHRSDAVDAVAAAR
jgi:signal transduction histidine kinase